MFFLVHRSFIMTQVVNRLYDINKPNRQFSTHFNAPQKLQIQKFFFFCGKLYFDSSFRLDFKRIWVAINFNWIPLFKMPFAFQNTWLIENVLFNEISRWPLWAIYHLRINHFPFIFVEPEKYGFHTKIRHSTRLNVFNMVCKIQFLKVINFRFWYV